MEEERVFNSHKNTGSASDDSLMRHFLSSGKVESLLKGIGFFIRDYAAQTCIPNSFWKDLGYGDGDFFRWKDFVHPDDQDLVYAFESMLIEGRADAWQGEFRIKGNDGMFHHIQHKALVLGRSETGIPNLYIGWDFDISEYIERAESASVAFKEQEQRFLRAEAIRSAGAILSAELDPEQAAKSILTQARQVVPSDAAAAWMLEGEEVVRLASLGPVEGLPAHRRLSPEDLSKHSRDRCVPRVSVDSYGLFAARLEIPLIHRNIVLGYLEFYSSDAAIYGSEECASALIFAEQASVAFANALRYRQSEREAATDWLTALPTRRAFISRASRLLASLGSEAPIAAMMIDIDHFKQVNDRYGHLKGDAALVAVAAACREVLRSEDIYCRYGGEEIVALLPGATEKAAMAVAERIRKRIMKIRLHDAKDLELSVSIGVTTGTGGEEFKALIARADEALYLAKNSGRNRCEIR